MKASIRCTSTRRTDAKLPSPAHLFGCSEQRCRRLARWLQAPWLQGLRNVECRAVLTVLSLGPGWGQQLADRKRRGEQEERLSPCAEPQTPKQPTRRSRTRACTLQRRRTWMPRDSLRVHVLFNRATLLMTRRRSCPARTTLHASHSPAVEEPRSTREDRPQGGGRGAPHAAQGGRGSQSGHRSADTARRPRRPSRAKTKVGPPPKHQPQQQRGPLPRAPPARRRSCS